MHNVLRRINEPKLRALAEQRETYTGDSTVSESELTHSPFSLEAALGE